MKRIIAMLLVLSLTFGLAPVGASADEIPSLERIEFEKPGITVNTQSRTSGFSTNYTLTGDGASDMVAIALAQEGRTGSDFGYTEDWCANFISDCAILAGQSDAIPQYGIVSGLYSRIISAGGTVTTSSPKPGDLCFIDWNKGSSMGHVEIVYAVSGTTVYTIGGNSGSGSLYTRSVKKHAPLSSGYIVSIVRPNYAGSDKNLPSEMTVTGLEMPDKIVSGSAPELSGTVSYANTITWIRVGIRCKNTNTTLSYAEAYPLSYTYDLKDLLCQLDFTGLESGEYILQVEATGGGQYWGVVYLADFSVEDPDFDAVDTVATGYSGNTTWVLTEDGILTFSGSGKMKNYTYKSEMPWYSYLDQITSVVIEKGVTSIGSYAFYGMSNLESITIAEGVTSIGDYAFKNCPVLDNVVLPTTLTQLGESAFYACSGLTAIEIPSKLYTIKPYTFKNCTALAEINFNEGNLMKISDGAFYNTALTEVSFPDCLGIIDVYAFKNCTKLAAITLGSGLTQIREAVFYGTAIPTIEIPEGVTSIGPYAFKNCTNLFSIDLPDTLTSVGEASFYACTALKSLDLPDAVTKIGDYAFRKCSALAEVSFGSGLTDIGESSFYGCEGLIYLNIPEGVKTIQGYAFKGCTNLEIVDLPDSLMTIGDSAFHTCANLSEVTIPANVTKIGAYCFSGSTGIRYITFEGSAPTIGTGAFNKITARAYYPSGNSTWTASVRQNYGGTITWTAQ